GADYRLRIFTPGTELPFAGHPSIGSAWVLHSLGRLDVGHRHQECGAGVLPITVFDDGAELTGGALTVGEALDAAPVLAAVGLTSDDLDPSAPPRWCGAGIEFLMLPLASREAVDRASPHGAGLLEVGQVFLVHFSNGTAYARMFGAALGVTEDPATGSAALGYGAWLAASGRVPPTGTSEYVVEQGHAMGRPSLLQCTVDTEDGLAVRCRVRGQVVPVASGRIRIP
ncbi:MAG TPA: PhzF family phenazine biosynthesis protein, partial [Mycobacteriales bacterium]|nr:PhzF family phenazine biosynthesis protein [Mycobacteriales bacterium]